MPDDDVYMETEDAGEWVFSTVMDSGGDGDEVLAAIEEALGAVLTGGEEVTEEDIDESIEDALSSLKEDYEEGEMSEDEYKRACSEAKDREVAKQQWAETDLDLRLSDGYAASELLAALLGHPGIIYEHVIEPSDDVAFNADNAKFERRARKIAQSHADSLKRLVPKALEVAKKLRTDEALKAMGIQMGEKDDYVQAWLDAYSRLERNLKTSQ